MQGFWGLQNEYEMVDNIIEVLNVLFFTLALLQICLLFFLPLKAISFFAPSIQILRNTLHTLGFKSPIHQNPKNAVATRVLNAIFQQQNLMKNE